ncbi:hypothetical protein ACH5RR_037857 [Cinchona calisaya]|uniref:Disease resistance protein n=1 Tax=Cinchona calisaya TaxID=153742 RepID=A0ABD2Y8Q2_9GENT
MVDKLIDFAVGALHDYCTLEVKMQNLERKIDILTYRANDVSTMIEEAELHSRKKRKREVEEWLEEVQSNQTEFASLKEQAQQARFLSRIQVARRVDKMLDVITDLIEQSDSFGELLLNLHEMKGMPLVAKEWKGQTFLQNLKEIWEWLMNDEISCIGIYGMGGVGKTTLATRVHNNLLNETKFFGHVFWVTASQEASIPKLQNAIARAINLDISSEDDDKIIAAKLFNALKRKEKLVTIVDDIWNHFDVERIGIPVGVNGSKLVVTSRSLEVCRRMGCQKEIKVKPLCGEEAWTLFLAKLSCPNELPSDVQEIAESMTKKCDGLPLAIITVAGSMKGVDDICDWRDALDELEGYSAEQDDEVFQILKYSFNRLRDQKLKDCFLYCSLYPEDYEISRDGLIRRFILEGLIEKRSRQMEFDNGHRILNRLENVCLLEGGTETNEEDREIKYVKMHDLIRDMALEMLKTEKTKYMVKAGIRLEDIPGANDWTEDLEKVSLMCNRISLIPSGTSPKCPKLSTLILKDNCLRSIPCSFFAQMGALQVLDLSSNMFLEELPNCISKMENLTALFLQNCYKLRFVPPLRKLKALRELDLFGTKIERVPAGLKELINLQHLDIGSTRIRRILHGTISKLWRLRSLRLPVEVEIRVEELEAIQHLEEFNGEFLEVNTFNQFVIYHKRYKRPSFYNVRLSCLRLATGLRIQTYYKRITRKTVTLHKVEFGAGKNEILLPEDIQELEMFDCHGLGSCLTDAFIRLNIQRRSLTSCLIQSSAEIKCILKKIMSSSDHQSVIGETQISPSFPLESLERLELFCLPNFVELCEWESVPDATLPLGTFSHLKWLNFISCDAISKLFTPKLLQHLHNLEVLKVSECEQLEEIIADEVAGCKASLIPSSSDPCSWTTLISLPKLKLLSLAELPSLLSICKETIICDSIEKVVIKDCPFLDRLPLFLPTVNGQPSPPPALKVIEIPERECDWWESLEWDNPEAGNVLQPLVCFQKYC